MLCGGARSRRASTEGTTDQGEDTEDNTLFALLIGLTTCAPVVIIALARRGVAQLGRALRSGRRGRRFKSCRLDQIITLISILTVSISALLSYVYAGDPKLGSFLCNCLCFRRQKRSKQYCPVKYFSKTMETAAVIAYNKTKCLTERFNRQFRENTGTQSVFRRRSDEDPFVRIWISLSGRCLFRSGVLIRTFGLCKIGRDTGR